MIKCFTYPHNFFLLDSQRSNIFTKYTLNIRHFRRNVQSAEQLLSNVWKWTTVKIWQIIFWISRSRYLFLSVAVMMSSPMIQLLARVRFVWRGPYSVCTLQPRTAAPCASVPNYICRHGRICYYCQPRPGVRSSAARVNIMTNTQFYYSKNWSLLLVSLFCVAESINLSMKCLFRHSTGEQRLLCMKIEEWRWEVCSWPNESCVCFNNQHINNLHIIYNR